ncbi:MAG: hypothetical protein AAF202_02130 [Pseudomonadota bacterium]
MTCIALPTAATDLTIMSRRRVLGLFASTLAAAATRTVPDFSAGTAQAAVPATGVSGKIPWGWVRSLSDRATLCTVDELFCMIHPEDRIDLIDRHLVILREYVNYTNVSLDEIETLVVARRHLLQFRALEFERLSLLEDLARQQANGADQDQKAPLSQTELLDLMSRHLPVDRLNRIQWQMAYPEENILLDEDLLAIEALVGEAGWSESLLVFSSPDGSNSCRIELSQ